MKLKGFIATTVAIALSAAPAVASSVAASVSSLTPTASARSVTPTASALSLTPAAETVDGSKQADAGTWVIIGLAAVAAGAGIWALADGGDDGEEVPASL